MPRRPPAFACRSCGDGFARWSGRCPSCGELNTVAEITAGEAGILARDRREEVQAAALVSEDAVVQTGPARPRIPTGMGEFDRVLGGGFTPGSSVLIGGEPGIGKSTLLAQAAASVARERKVLYATAEEGLDQIRARLARLGLLDIPGGGLRLAASSDTAAIAAAAAGGGHDLVVVDSIQLMASPTIDGEAGSVSQVRTSAATLVEAARRGGACVVLVGHVTKDGSLAGPRMLEHLVDTVISFEGDRYQDLRILRSIKNRHGPTSEIGLLRMGQRGLEEVPDPSGWFLGDRLPDVPGSCVTPILEGGRCLLVEVQALVNPSDFPQPQRRVQGLDGNRVAMVLAVLSRRVHLPLGGCEVFVNVTGGARISEPSADLAVALAIASAWHDQALPADLVALGEIGLGGELRPSQRYEIRANEARRLGFQRLIGPGGGSGRGRLIAHTIAEAIAIALPR